MATSDRNYALDGLRGLAALAVALGHCDLTVTGLGVWDLRLSTFHGHMPTEIVWRLVYVVFPSDPAVVLFFVLSGHVLWESFFKRYPVSLGAFPDYVSSRLYRLIPTTIACAIPLALVAGTWAPAIDATDLVKNMLILSNKTNGSLWSLQVEMVASLLLFFVWLLVRRVFVLHILVLLVSMAALWVYQSVDTLFFWSFIAGSLVARVPVWARQHRFLILVGVPLLVASSVLFGHDWRARYCETAGAFMIVTYVRNVQPMVLGTGPVHFLGRISYPFYLLHIVGLQVTAPWVARYSGGQDWAAVLIFAAGSLAVSIPLAWLVHRLVEIPVMRGRPRLKVLHWPWGRRSSQAIGRVGETEPIT